MIVQNRTVLLTLHSTVLYVNFSFFFVPFAASESPLLLSVLQPTFDRSSQTLLRLRGWYRLLNAPVPVSCLCAG
jgi:cytochrome c biogenesis factor